MTMRLTLFLGEVTPAGGEERLLRPRRAFPARTGSSVVRREVVRDPPASPLELLVGDHELAAEVVLLVAELPETTLGHGHGVAGVVVPRREEEQPVALAGAPVRPAGIDGLRVPADGVERVRLPVRRGFPQDVRAGEFLDGVVERGVRLGDVGPERDLGGVDVGEVHATTDHPGAGGAGADPADLPVGVLEHDPLALLAASLLRLHLGGEVLVHGFEHGVELVGGLVVVGEGDGPDVRPGERSSGGHGLPHGGDADLAGFEVVAAERAAFASGEDAFAVELELGLVELEGDELLGFAVGDLEERVVRPEVLDASGEVGGGGGAHRRLATSRMTRTTSRMASQPGTTVATARSTARTSRISDDRDGDEELVVGHDASSGRLSVGWSGSTPKNAATSKLPECCCSVRCVDLP
jgi:hypothetical protein